MRFMSSRFLPVEPFLCITPSLFYFTYSSGILRESLNPGHALTLWENRVACEQKELAVVMFMFLPFKNVFE